MRPYQLYIFDLDGTLYRGDEVINGTPEAVQRLRDRGAKVRFLTNNSSQERSTFLGKLTKMGFAPSEEEIYSSGIGTGLHLRSMGLSSAFVIGEPGLARTLEGMGVQTGDDAVVAGIDRNLTYAKIDAALQLLQKGVPFFATNTDATFPLEAGRVSPGAGATVGALIGCSGRQPVVIGKPEPFLVELILREAGIEPGEALVVGDRYETDIVAGQRACCDTLLVLTGVAQVAPEGQSWLPSVADIA